MNEDKIKGKGKQIEGEIKDRAGGALGDTGTKTEGKMEKGAGKVQESWGDMKDRMKKDDTRRR